MAASKPVGYAVIGLGGFAQRAILPGFKHSKKGKLVALVSGDKLKAQRLARKFGAGASYTYDELPACLSDPQVEAVYIATNNGSHARYTVQAANAGKHVLCEKPMANSVEECRQMLAACRASDVRLMIAYRKYFEPSSLELKKLYHERETGAAEVHPFRLRNLSPARLERGAWHLDPKLSGGGSLPDVGVYCVNTIRWLVGEEPSAVSAYQWAADPKRFSQVDENIAFRLDFPSGIVAQCTSSFQAAESSFLQVNGEKGWACLSPAYQYDLERRLFGEIAGRRLEKKFKVIDELALEIDALADAVRRRREPEPNGVQGMRDMAVMEAIYQSAREGRTVPVTMPE